jgi:hypothetical protein
MINLKLHCVSRVEGAILAISSVQKTLIIYSWQESQCVKPKDMTDFSWILYSKMKY